MGAYLSAALSTLSQSDGQNANLVNKYFSQLTASYFGQDALALRGEAYDDMLWVVLGWIESIKFVNLNTDRHYTNSTSPWYGTIWTPVFAHRARLFWDLASQGWDTTLCDGGMVWNPYLEPYKNAITNELYITASISMYLYFPGDENASPFSSPILPARDPKYLAAAIEGYRWLLGSNMTDAGGLYVDGYHISGWTKNNTQKNKRCDARNEMVYTYNQGVLLSGQRGLYEATGARSYLWDGHKLISDVMSATGWEVRLDVPLNDWDEASNLGKWHGLGRGGIMEEFCDAGGYCSQDGQTFKGIFFHHLTTFCAPLPDHLVLQDKSVLSDAGGSLEKTRKHHRKKCAGYGKWIKHNAKGALNSRNLDGKFGTWWGSPPGRKHDQNVPTELPVQAVDYRNLGVPKAWKGRPLETPSKDFTKHTNDQRTHVGEDHEDRAADIGIMDLNDRGRGRTVETQGGGLAVLRALWELVESPEI
ncbi:glycosyl hydrolase family 76-domain-containing protein [Amylocarpus encephaloides]|uniref:Glycosyl hydrolase family 76-domain-containing protein n=1 Tax=Amylocarpus encephaloides TaxID=45428 RepID=A0A9P7YCD8_9HELO|nr:glycosyl hydrolase family 76-domain-containing protein [Amylocarpus encephaloides]